MDPESENQQVARLKAFKENRDQAQVDAQPRGACATPPRGTDNLLPFIKDALRDRASLGEVCGAMQDVFGKYTPTF